MEGRPWKAGGSWAESGWQAGSPAGKQAGRQPGRLAAQSNGISHEAFANDEGLDAFSINQMCDIRHRLHDSEFGVFVSGNEWYGGSVCDSDNNLGRHKSKWKQLHSRPYISCPSFVFPPRKNKVRKCQSLQSARSWSRFSAKMDRPTLSGSRMKPLGSCCCATLSKRGLHRSARSPPRQSELHRSSQAS